MFKKIQSYCAISILILICILNFGIITQAVAENHKVIKTGHVDFNSIYSQTSRNRLYYQTSSVFGNSYQAFTLNQSATIESIEWRFYTESQCNNISAIVNVGSAQPNTLFNAGTYTARDQALYNICDSMSGGCASEATSVNSIQVVYHFQNGFTTYGQCYNNPEGGDKLSSGGSTCTGAGCHFTGKYLPDAVSESPVAYITNYWDIPYDSGNFAYTKCNIGINGLLESSTCQKVYTQSPGKLDGPTGIVIYNGFAYIADYGYSNAANQYTQCVVTQNGIESDTCTTVEPQYNGSDALNYPADLVAIGHYIYFTNSGANSYTQCSLDENGIESDTCTPIIPTTPGALNGPNGIGVKGNLIYFTNWLNSYTYCSFDADGLVDSSSCTTVTPTVGLLNNPYDITFKGRYAYFTNWQNNSPGKTYAKCSVNANNIINENSCQIVTPPLDTPNGLTFYSNKAYFMNQNDQKYTQCNVAANGLIDSSNCGTIIMSTLLIPQFMAVY